MRSETSQAQVVSQQADGIDRVLAGYGVRARVMAIDVLPRYVAYKLGLTLGVKVSEVAALEEELALALGVDSVRVAAVNGALCIQVPHEERRVVRLLPVVEKLARKPAHAATLGLDENGQPLLLCLAGPEACHVLVAGSTGCGKTSLARAMIASLALCNPPRTVQLGLLDPKGRAYYDLAGMAHVLFYETEPDHCVARARWLVGEMLRRDEQRRSAPRIVLFIDELADLVMATGDAFVEPLTRLTQRGREAGVHVVACTQKPVAEVMGALAKVNFPARIVGKVPDAATAVTCAGVAGTGAERLQGRGDMVVVVAGDVTRIQGVFVSEEDVREVAGQVGLGRQLEMRDDPPSPLPPKTWRDADAYRRGVSAGRPEEEIPGEWVAAVREYREEHGAWPSAWMVRELFGVGNGKARRVIDMAREAG